MKNKKRSLIFIFLIFSLQIFSEEKLKLGKEETRTWMKPFISKSIFENKDLKIDKEFRVILENILFLEVLKKEKDNKSVLIKKLKKYRYENIKNGYNYLKSKKIDHDKIISLFNNNIDNESKIIKKIAESLKMKISYDEFIKLNIGLNKDENSYRFYQDYYNNELKWTYDEKYINYSAFKKSDDEIDGYDLNNGEVLMSFDDGVSNITPLLLKELKKINIKVSFFIVGNTVRENIKTIERMISDGHGIGLHTNTHPHLVNLNEDQLEEELTSPKNLLKDKFAINVKYFRTPYGERSVRELEEIAKYYKKNIIWNIDTQDWREEFTEEIIIDRVMRLVHLNNGGIILAHDVYDKTLEFSPILLLKIKKAGFKFITLKDIK